VTLHWSIEPEPLETLGGIATARPMLADGPLLVVSGDLWTAYDYGALEARRPSVRRSMHLVMVPNPPYHPRGDFTLDGPRLATGGSHALTYGNIGLYDAALFDELPRGEKLKLLPLMLDLIRDGARPASIIRAPGPTSAPPTTWPSSRRRSRTPR
jgi:MurNAc alpha-1-phosphate uridylyltransferase